MHGPINVKSPNNISKWQMGFNSAFKGLINLTRRKNTLGLIKIIVLRKDRDNTVGIATRYELDRPEIESRWWREFPHPSIPTLVYTQPPIQCILGLFRG
jgi:hypothetical protein